MTLPPEPPKADLAGRRILIVDDDRLNLRILGNILKPEGYVVSEACSGEEALRLYEELKPDLVLLDVIMPGISGFETCRALKAKHAEKLAPVIFITAKSQSDDIVEGLEAGGVDYLPKPFKPREALARLRTHLQNRILNEQQRQLVDQLSLANTAKNRLLGMAAHDLRNPLASIRGLAEFLQDGTVGTLTAEQNDLVTTILDASHIMLTMVNELLDLSVIESGELKIHSETRPVADLLTKAIYLNNINAGKKGSRIELTGSADPTPLRIDADKVRQVLDNLLSNAIKFSPANSVIRVQTETNDAYYSIMVKDQGPGIPANERHKLFQDFGQTSVKPTGGEKSTGLGLAICRRIMEAHGGTISADSNNQGSVFKISFPLFT